MNRSTDSDFFALLTGSFARLVGTKLLPEGTSPEWLYADAPFAVLAHDNGPDPKFVYANRCAQVCFEYDWEEMVALAVAAL